MLLTPIQPKILTSKISHFAPHYTNKYAKEKEKEKEKEEKNKTVFHKMT